MAAMRKASSSQGSAAREARVLRLIFQLCILAVFCFPIQSTKAQSAVGGPLETLDHKAIFVPKPSWQAILEKMQACKQAAGGEERTLVSCVVLVMQEAGASPEAIAFTTALKGEGYLDSFQEMGRVDLATILYPFRANDNGAEVLVNGIPSIVDPEDSHFVGQIDIRKDRLYESLRKRFPRLQLWGHAQFKVMRHLPGGGQRFVFNLTLLNGCHACEVAGYARIGFDFDGSGKFLAAKLLQLSKVA